MKCSMSTINTLSYFWCFVVFIISSIKALDMQLQVLVVQIFNEGETGATLASGL